MPKKPTLRHVTAVCWTLTLITIASIAAAITYAVRNMPADASTSEQAWLLGIVAISAVAMLTSLGIACSFVAHSAAQLTRVLDVSDTTLERAEATLDRVSGLVNQLRQNPQTAAAGQRAMDEIRNLWGEKADRWTDRSDLN